MATVFIIMGVSGCGKTTIGKTLADKLGIPFFDGDDFHPQSNIDKMKKGNALNDDDRKPWLEILATNIQSWETEKGAVLACSALKENYRMLLSSKVNNLNWVFLKGSFATIESRMRKRANHYMKSTLLQSQFDTLEVPNYGLHLDIEKDTNEIINEIIKNTNR